MKLFSALLICICLYNCKAKKATLYVGTYTSDKANGIYKYDFNLKNGKLSNQELAINIDNPSFLAFSPNRKFLYSVNQTDEGFVSSYKIAEDGKLILQTRVSSHGKGPCHIAINEEGNKAAVSNYGGGTVAIYPITENGTLLDAAQIFNHNSKNEDSHAHSAQFFKDDLFVADLGRNAVYEYYYNGDNYVLESQSIVEMKGNPGPRHFAMTKDGENIYVINEYASTITSIEKTRRGFKQIDYDSTLNDGYNEKNSCADIHLSKDEKFLYGSNRGENSIAVFERNTRNGTIERIQNIGVEGDWPRNFTLDPSGKFLLVANRKSDNISVFEIDKKSGKLSFLKDFKSPEPVCLLF